MSTIPTITITPSAAAEAYSRASQGGAASSDAGGFGATLEQAMRDAVTAGHDAEAKSMQAISGTGSLTDVVTALSRAELALQTATAIRDRVVQAYQDIMKMPI
jgi:flagellar hook-basal body complex protein FliE